MKKVAIMTWYHYPNFGTALQVTASSYIIKKLGYTPEVINYIPHGKVVNIKKNKLTTYIKKINSKFNRKQHSEILDEKRIQIFQEFIKKNITLTNECKIDTDFFNLNEKYDAFICGSDQIWAPSLFNSKYFLEFVHEQKKMIAYAPSIGLSEIKDKYVKNRMKECIDRFENLSIREEQGKALIKNICNKEAEVVLDPTLLLVSNEWDTMSINFDYEKPYILCYFLGYNKETWEHVKKLSKKLNIDIKVIPVFKEDLNRGFDIAKGVGPGEFLSLVKNASFVCTDSFHGTAFSINYEIPFYVYERFSNKDTNSQNSRIYNVLKLANLEERLIKDKSTLNQNPLKCTFEETRKRIEVQREKSINYLRKSLEKSTTSIETINEYMITNTCCGCGVCSEVCNHGAINFKRNMNGFFEASVDTDKCRKCGLCKKVCPYNGEKSDILDKNKSNLFMAQSEQNDTLKVSSSGGIAHEISKELCDNGYDIIGCKYDKESKEAIHDIVLAGNIDNLNVFQGSKYIQSNSKKVLGDIVNESEKAIVFGTPCQVAGIDKLLRLKNKRDKFILVDLICHGVPTQNLWNKYLKEGSIKYGYGVNPEANFRDKPKGWRKMHISIRGNGKTFTCIDKKDLFYRFFLLGHCYMPACYECAYRTASAADIRLGDYWGPRYKKVKDGVSMVIAMNKKGEETLIELKKKNKIELQKMDCNEYWTVQYPQNPIKPVFYNELIEELKDESIELRQIANKYCLPFEKAKKIVKPYRIVVSIYKKVRKIK